MRKFLLAASLALCVFALFAQDRSHAYEINERLGRGINMGNAFEAPTETEWGNPWKPEYFQIIAELGFDHVRVPIRWEPEARSMAEAPYTIEPEFMQRIQTVVDEALKNKLHIVFNMHHHEALFEDPAGQKDRFLAQWSQIAEHFQSYPDSVLFELLNEPNGNLTAELWNDYSVAALAEIRETNPDRVVLIGSAEWGGIGGMAKLQLPDDENLIFTVHYYNPFNFTHQGAEWSSGMEDVKDVKWYDSVSERNSIHQDFALIKAFAAENNIPVHVGEFGSYSKADIDSRVRWTTYLARWMEGEGFSWAYWEFSAGFGIYDPVNEELLQPLVDALLTNPIPEPAETVTTTAYEHDFSEGNDGWSVNFQQGTAGTYEVIDGKMTINITTPGTDAWHIQLMQFFIPLKEGKNYRISFTASASTPLSVTQYLGQNGGDWGAYSSYNTASLTTEDTEFEYTFMMGKADDDAARIVFDLGSMPADATFYLKNFTLEEVSIIPNAIDPISILEKVRIQFSPDQNELYIDNEQAYKSLSVYSITGKLMLRENLTLGTNRLDVSRLQKGTYLIRVEGNTGVEALKLLKSR